MTPEILIQLAELEAKATPGPWDTVNHESMCGGMGCTPNGCPGHDTGVAYNIDGPMLLRDGEPPTEIREEEKAALRQADIDSRFISLFRQHANELIQLAKEALEQRKVNQKCW